MAEASKPPKKPMTDEERQELAARLDRELDDFINTLPKKKYEDGWPEDRWEEEMEKHPFFMTKLPEEGAELHPLYEGLQKLKYDPEENEPEELAIAYKDDGNFNFKHKNYRLAVLAYTEGINIKCDSPDVNASLLNNRAAAHYFLKNYRSSLKDCELALKIQPNYEKTLLRAANCCYETKRFPEAIAYIDRVLDLSSTNEKALELRRKCVTDKKSFDRDQRKKEIREKIKESELAAIVSELNRLKIHIAREDGPVAWDCLKVNQPDINACVRIENNELVWPVLLLYPELETKDVVLDFASSSSLENILTNNLPDLNEYSIDSINVYHTYSSKRQRINIMKPLGDILKGETVYGGMPSFSIFVKNCRAEQLFLAGH